MAFNKGSMPFGGNVKKGSAPNSTSASKKPAAKKKAMPKGGAMQGKPTKPGQFGGC